ncbi:MAG TPA: imidazole glycerol phosphate synthase subunit HisH [Candidatus Eremiobacteraceae bacterium]|nr:imidazole glycerol phosphate synthase subunit HisH [Candidatus Eremiobacteraceae bacterium]
MVTVIDYGAGNVTSVTRALRRLGAEVGTTNQAEEITDATCLVLPGVGHCAALIRALDAGGLRQPLLTAIARGTPFLGICLGLQVLYQTSAEAPELSGLGIMPGNVEQLPQNVKLPHMGWNRLRSVRDCRLLDDISSDAYFYFAHSYAAPADGPATGATCVHGREFSAVLETERIFGVQFHPEKSGSAGAKLLENFLRLSA